jgi:hypothetical protein
MKHLISAFALLVLVLSAYGKNRYIVLIEEGYNQPTTSLFNAGDEFQINSIKNGMYISKTARMHAQIDFPYSMHDRLRKCINSSDMEYTIVKLKGDKESFICVQVDPLDEVYPYLVFQYNELGDWKLTNYRQDKTYASGKAKVNAGIIPNMIKVVHRYNKISYYVNGELATELKADNTLEIRWYNNKVYSKNKKFVLSLDKLILGGCVTDKEDLLKEQKRKEEETARIASEKPAPPNPIEVIDYNLETKPTHELKTQTYSLKVYPAWANIFKNVEKRTSVLSTYLLKFDGFKSADLFSGAPEGWIKNGSKTEVNFSGNINIRMDEEESTIPNQIESSREFLSKQSGVDKNKVEMLQEEVILADGRKGILLFYYTGMTDMGVAIAVCEIISPVASDLSKINKFAIITNTNDLGFTLETKDYEGWKDYFKEILLTIHKI